MKKYFGLLALLFLSLNAKADLVGTVWLQQTELTRDGKLLCSFDHSKQALLHENGGYLRIDKWNNGWFRIEAGSGCALGWFGNHSFAFQQVGADILDKSGNKVGSISNDAIVINSGSDEWNEVQIQKLSILKQSDGTSKIVADFTIKNQYGYKVINYTGKLFPW